MDGYGHFAFTVNLRINFEGFAFFYLFMCVCVWNYTVVESCFILKLLQSMEKKTFSSVGSVQRIVIRFFFNEKLKAISS